MVDERGCWVIQNIEFDYNKYNIKEQYYPRLNKVVAILMNNPGLKVEIAGHTDGIGSSQYNQTLSEKRAQAVKEYIVNQGIPSSQLLTAGFGKEKPIAPNTTEEGRAKNRRVELTPIEF
jgi:OOP family OmpA-OmpF porin